MTLKSILLSLNLFFFITLSLIYASIVKADDVDVECKTSGDYGQSTYCEVKVHDDEEEEKVTETVIIEGKEVPVHIPVNTAINPLFFQLIAITFISTLLFKVFYYEK